MGDLTLLIFAITFHCTVQYIAMGWHFPLLACEFTIEN